MNIDPRVDIDPDDNCALCGEPLLDENNLVLIESGEMAPMRKDPRFLRFKPDRDRGPDTPSYGTISLFHVHCVLTRGDARLLDWSEESSKICLCERPFRADQQAYALVVGKVDEDILVFVPNDEDKSCRILCEECTADSIGDGDMEEGMALLEATG